MSLIISGKPFIKGSIKAKVPTETYSGEGDPASSVATNPYTGNSPVIPGILQIFNYTGSMQTFTVPAGNYSINVELWGAGGGGSANSTAVHISGPGGYSSGTLLATGGDVLNILVAGGGIEHNVNSNPALGGRGGFGGGGSGGGNNNDAIGGGGGGGRSSIAINSLTEIITAGGGGGSGIRNYISKFGGPGGGLVGGNGENSNPPFGIGGTQLAFTNGLGTDGTLNGNGGGGGGGGGWNGGTAGISGGSVVLGGGGGGSSHGDSTSITNFNTIMGTSGVIDAPNNTSPNYAAGVAVGGTTSTGGNGLVVIRYKQI